MNTIKLKEDQFALLRSGHSIETPEGDAYYHYPFWIRPLEFDDEKKIHTCELLTRSEIPTTEVGYKKGGLKQNKYIIKKGDNTPIDPEAWYFVLRIDKDPHARVAAMEYAASIGSENPKLAGELMDAIMKYYPEQPLKTSEEWSKYYPFKILDPDGWDRTEFVSSWHNEIITWEEFNNRAGYSTIVAKEGEK